MSTVQFDLTDYSPDLKQFAMSNLQDFEKMAFDFPEKFAFRLPVLYSKEGESWCVEVPILPGVCSYGDTVEEALSNIREAAEGCLEEYLHQNLPIPWVSLDDITLPQDSDTEFVKWVALHVPAVS